MYSVYIYQISWRDVGSGGWGGHVGGYVYIYMYIWSYIDPVGGLEASWRHLRSSIHEATISRFYDLNIYTLTSFSLRWLEIWHTLWYSNTAMEFTHFVRGFPCSSVYSDGIYQPSLSPRGPRIEWSMAQGDGFPLQRSYEYSKVLRCLYKPLVFLQFSNDFVIFPSFFPMVFGIVSPWHHRRATWAKSWGTAPELKNPSSKKWWTPRPLYVAWRDGIWWEGKCKLG